MSGEKRWPSLFEQKREKKIYPNKVVILPAHKLLALSGLSFLVAGILWVVGELSFGLIGVGAVCTGCYLIILALKKRR